MSLQIVSTVDGAQRAANVNVAAAVGLEEALEAFRAHVQASVRPQRHAVHRGVRKNEGVARGVEAALAPSFL